MQRKSEQLNRARTCSQKGLLRPIGNERGQAIADSCVKIKQPAAIVSMRFGIQRLFRFAATHKIYWPRITSRSFVGRTSLSARIKLVPSFTVTTPCRPDRQ